MKIAYLDYSSVFAGAERVLYNMIAHINREQFEPIIIFPYPREHQERYSSLGCKMEYLADGLKWWMGSDRYQHPLRGTDLLKRFEFGRRIAAFINREKIDVLHVNLLRPDCFGWLYFTKHFTKAKIVGHFRSQALDWVPSPAVQRLCDVVLCVSEYSRSRFLSKGENTRTEVMYDSVDTDAMQCDLTKAEAKNKLGFSEDTILISSVGQLSRHKGHDNAIRAYAKIAKKFPNTMLFVAGGGKASEVDYLKSLAKEGNIEDRVKIPGKQLSNIQEVYRASDLTLTLTKVGEAFGLVPYEAALLGSPFIGPDLGAVKEFVTDGENGLLVDTNNVDTIADKIEFALLNPDKTADMVSRLDALIHAKLKPSVLSQNLSKLYLELNA